MYKAPDTLLLPSVICRFLDACTDRQTVRQTVSMLVRKAEEGPSSVHWSVIARLAQVSTACHGSWPASVMKFIGNAAASASAELQDSPLNYKP